MHIGLERAFPIDHCGGRFMRQNCFLNGYLWPFSRWLVVCQPKKEKERQSISIFHQGRHWGCVPVLSFLFTHLPEWLGKRLGRVA